MRYQTLSRYSDADFKRLVGVPRSHVQEMVQVLDEAEQLKKKSGRPHTLSMEDQLLLKLNYLWHYNTQLELSASYAIAENNVNRTIHKVENALMRSRKFTLLKRQRNSYSGNKKRHTLKTQIIYHPHSQQILIVRIDNGHTHDISITKKTMQDLCHYCYVMADLGYYGLKEVGFKLLTPLKKSKNIALSKEAKAFHRKLSKYRIKTIKAL